MSELFSGRSGHINATIEFTAMYDDNNNVRAVYSVWKGGDTAGISKELMDDANPLYLQRDGDVVTTGNLRLQIIGFDGRTYLVKRLAHEQGTVAQR